MFSSYLDIIGATFGEDRRRCPDPDPEAEDFSPNLLVDFGLLYLQEFKKLLIPNYARAENNTATCKSRLKANAKKEGRGYASPCGDQKKHTKGKYYNKNATLYEC